jgi:predicted GIY-YIG superfamily endonuclease
MYWRPTVVYRCYDAEGTLLYVGLSNNLVGRIAKHKRRDWWPDVASLETVEYPDRESAQYAERDAIHHEKPVHNLVRPRMECC